MYSDLPGWSVDLRGYYWHLRYCRVWNSACKQRQWRKIRREKKRLLMAGVPYIEVHLVTRVLCNPQNQNAQGRLQNYFAQGRLFG
jgi:hypothetical protein